MLFASIEGTRLELIQHILYPLFFFSTYSSFHFFSFSWHLNVNVSQRWTELFVRVADFLTVRSDFHNFISFPPYTCSKFSLSNYVFLYPAPKKCLITQCNSFFFITSKGTFPVNYTVPLCYSLLLILQDRQLKVRLIPFQLYLQHCHYYLTLGHLTIFVSIRHNDFGMFRGL